jgi:hypothetical protein
MLPYPSLPDGHAQGYPQDSARYDTRVEAHHWQPGGHTENETIPPGSQHRTYPAFYPGDKRYYERVSDHQRPPDVQLQGFVSIFYFDPDFLVILLCSSRSPNISTSHRTMLVVSIR